MEKEQKKLNSVVQTWGLMPHYYFYFKLHTGFEFQNICQGV